MTAFAVPAARRALAQRLRLALEGVHVQRGLPADLADVPDSADRVYVLSARDVRRDLVTQQGARGEEFELLLRVETRTYGRDERDACEDRLWSLLGAVDDAIEDDDTLAGASSGSALVGVDGDAVDPVPDGWVGHAQARVRVELVLAGLGARPDSPWWQGG